MEKLQQAVTEIEQGNKAVGRKLLLEVIEADSHHEMAWLWMATIVEFDESRQQCLKKVLEINPDNEMAQKGLNNLQTKVADSLPQASTPSVYTSQTSSPKPLRSIWSGGATKVIYLLILISMLVACLPTMFWLYTSGYVDILDAIVYGILAALVAATIVALPIALFVGVVYSPTESFLILRFWVRLFRSILGL